MSLSIMPLLIVFASRFAGYGDCHQRQVRRPQQHEGGTTCSQACCEAAPKGKHVQLFKMKRKVGKGFYSTPVHGQ